MTTVVFFTLILHVLASLDVLTAEKNCSDFDLPNCSCKSHEFDEESDFYVHFRCPGIKDEDTLRHVLQILKDVPEITLELFELQFPYLPLGIFKNATIKHLVIRGSQTMTSLAHNDTEEEESVFDGLEEHLESLTIVDNPRMTTVQLREVRRLRNLQKLAIIKVPVDMSRGLSRLRPLEEIAICKTATNKEFKRFAFFHMTNLIAAYLYGNKHLERISRDLFPRPAEKLRGINMENNSIEEIPRDMFDEMPELLFLKMAGNRIFTFYESTFAPVWKYIMILSISGNPLHCDEHALWILQMDYQTLTDVNLLTCASPENLRGRKLDSLQESELKTGNNL